MSELKAIGAIKDEKGDSDVVEERSPENEPSVDVIVPSDGQRFREALAKWHEIDDY